MKWYILSVGIKHTLLHSQQLLLPPVPQVYFTMPTCTTKQIKNELNKIKQNTTKIQDHNNRSQNLMIMSEDLAMINAHSIGPITYLMPSELPDTMCFNLYFWSSKESDSQVCVNFHEYYKTRDVIRGQEMLCHLHIQEDQLKACFGTTASIKVVANMHGFEKQKDSQNITHSLVINEDGWELNKAEEFHVCSRCVITWDKK